jgi:hypothetical protein
MKGDFSRLTFDPASGFTQVLRQQGRVDIDADWNEQQAIHAHLDRTTGRDVIGQSGAPEADPGFAISNAGGLQIGSGRFYVEGQLIELPAAIPLADQPHLAGLSPFLNSNGNPIANPTSGRYLFFLETWDHHTTAVEVPALKEKALGGPDTTTRLRSVWRVRALRIGSPGGSEHCETSTAAWLAMTGPPSGTLAAQAQPVADDGNLCTLPETAGYQSLDHRLYRVEVHDAGQPDGATFKWSRDNGSFVAAWLARNGNEITVATTGFDAHIGFRNGGWIELTSEDRELAGLPGTMVRVARVAGDVLEIEPATATGPLDLGVFGATPKVRAWDSPGPVTITAGGFLALENGVEVEFGNGSYRTGDYWTIPARSGFGLEWPMDGNTPRAVPRHGTPHRFARLALLDFQGGAWSFIADCRALFPAVTELLTLDALGGDAQEIAPDPAAPNALLPLRRPLVVGVARGQYPVANARVRFRVSLGNGRLAGGGTEQVVTTGNDGTASVGFSLDSTSLDQSVQATLLSPGGAARHLTHTFTARLSRAAEVSFDPANCPPLAGDRTVQAAIERLCQLDGNGCATYVLSPDSDWAAVLESMKEGEDAHVCFQRGVFETRRRVTLARLGHVRLTGGGPGSRIIIRGGECALHFRDCESLGIADLAFEAPHEGQPQERRPETVAVVMANGCGAVDVQNVSILTAGGDISYRACLAVLHEEGRPLADRVLVHNNRFRAGNAQNALIVQDAEWISIEGNRITSTGQPQQPTIPPDMIDIVMDRLVRDVVTGAEPVRPTRPAPGTAEISVGGFKAVVPSTVDQADWETAVRANPPTSRELASEATFERYIDRVADTLASNPRSSPSLVRVLTAVGGVEGIRQPNREITKRLVLSEGRITVGPAAVDDNGRNVTIRVGRIQIAFNSDLSQANWDNLLELAPPGRVTTTAMLEAAVRDAARKMLTDRALADRLPFARLYIDGLLARLAPVARSGIVCVGNVLPAVSIVGNVFERVMEAIRVAAQGTATPDLPARIGSITVSDNRIDLALPFSVQRGGQAILVGGAERAMMSGNEIAYRAAENAPVFADGIELRGSFGPQIHLRENTVENTITAIRVAFIGTPPKPEPRPMWRATANLSVHGAQDPFVFTTADGSQTLPFIEQDNLRV